MEPDEGCVLASSRRRDQDVDELRGWPPDAVLLESGRTGDHAAATRVEHGGHLLLDDGGRPGRSQVDAGHQALPRVPEAETMPEGTSGDASGERLTAGDHLKLLVRSWRSASSPARVVKLIGASCDLGPTNLRVACRELGRPALERGRGRPRRQPEAPPGAPMKHRCRCGDSNVSSVSLVTRREECGPGRRLGPVGGLGHVGCEVRLWCGRGLAAARRAAAARGGAGVGVGVGVGARGGRLAGVGGG